MLNNVVIAAYGNTKSTNEDIIIENKLLEATKSLFDQNSNLSQKDIDGVLISTNDTKKYLSAILSELSGIQPKIAHTIESLCNSGSNAIVSGISYIAAGLANSILIVGAERFDSPGQILEWDSSRGEFKHPIYWASLFTKSYKREFSIKEEDLAIVSAKNHKHAKDNPMAYSNKEYSVDDILNSKKITDELRILDCSRPCTGASAILLTSTEISKTITDTPVYIKGIGQKTTSASFTKNETFSHMKSTQEAAEQAFLMSKKSPNEINVAEIHDAFAVCEPMALESLGIVQKGKGANFVKELYQTENKMINSRGGLIGSGHPLGATGISQTIEVTQQLQGKAGKRQIENPKTGLVHNMSAASTSSTVLILE